MVISVLVFHTAARPRPHAFFILGVLARLPAAVPLTDPSPIRRLRY